MALAGPLVFVFHPVVGVTRVPQPYMDAYEASGFRYATAAEVARWFDERGVPRPPRLPVTLPDAPYAATS